MGGGGSYYDRDVTDRRQVRSSGFSDRAEDALSRSNLDSALIPRNRRLTATCKSPVVLALDATGSMGRFPKIFWDKLPMIAGQLIERGYLEEPMASLAVVGDLVCDNGPIQTCDFALVRNLDDWLQRLWLEEGGGGQAKESYELTAYFYARRCEISNAVTPFFIFIGDEGFREKLLARDIKKYIDGEHEDVDSKVIFEELKQKFKGNVFLIHRRYHDSFKDGEIVKQWKELLGEEKVIMLGPDDMAIGDIMLGIFALVTGRRTLDEYLADMKTRKQTDERIAQVKESLKTLTEAVKSAPKPSTPKASEKTEQKPKKEEKKKVGRL